VPPHLFFNVGAAGKLRMHEYQPQEAEDRSANTLGRLQFVEFLDEIVTRWMLYFP